MKRNNAPRGKAEPLTPGQRKHIRFLMKIYKRVNPEWLPDIMRNAEQFNNFELRKTCQILLKRKELNNGKNQI